MSKDNVVNVRHCVTRLRFVLKDESKADDDYLKQRDGVVLLLRQVDNIKLLSEITFLMFMHLFLKRVFLVLVHLMSMKVLMLKKVTYSIDLLI